jgi:hypothetical protein
MGSTRNQRFTELPRPLWSHHKADVQFLDGLGLRRGGRRAHFVS